MRKKLREEMQAYLATLDNSDKDEGYDTHRGFAETELDGFLSYLERNSKAKSPPLTPKVHVVLEVVEGYTPTVKRVLMSDQAKHERLSNWEELHGPFEVQTS